MTRLMNDEGLELTPRSDPTPLASEEDSRALTAGGREEGVVNEEGFRRETELKAEDLDEIARERQDLVRTFHAEQGAQTLDPGELTRVLGPPPSLQEGEREEAHQGPEADGQPARTGRGRQVLGTPTGERALALVTQGVGARFAAWLRHGGPWHQRSEWLRKHLARVWEYAPDALNPGTLLFAPRGRARLAGYLRAEPEGETAVGGGKTGTRPGESPRGDGREAPGTGEDPRRTRTRLAAAGGQYERQLREARVRAVQAATRTVNKVWAEARDPSWALNASNDDPGAFLKTSQEGALDRWAGAGPERGGS